MNEALRLLFPDGPSSQSPGELYMAFGPYDRVVKLKLEGGGQALAHVCRGADKLWRPECGPQAFVDDSDGSSLYQALRALVDHCPILVELEP
jgi:hypothetical protein